jgi:hypothetical protein
MSFKINCGPNSDKREFYFKLHPFRRKIAVLVSGGIDSAILYYIIQKAISESSLNYTCTPFTILRKEGSPIYAPLVIQYVNSLFNIPFIELNIVGDNLLEEHLQVGSAEKEIHKDFLANILYVGLIETLEIHTIGWLPPYNPIETENTKYPLKNLSKPHVIDLFYQLGQQKLLEFTHSCVFADKMCLNCNGCTERQYGFNKLGKIDPRLK